MNFHTVKIGVNRYARFFSFGVFSSWESRVFNGYIAIQSVGYADWSEVPISQLPNESDCLIWDSGRIM